MDSNNFIKEIKKVIVYSFVTAPCELRIDRPINWIVNSWLNKIIEIVNFSHFWKRNRFFLFLDVGGD